MTQFNEVGPAPEPEKPKKYPCKCRIIGIAILVVLIAGVVCWHVHRTHRSQTTNLEPGKTCVVYLRRDALGLSTTASPSVTTVNNTDLILGGKLVAVTREAVLLERVNATRTRNGMSIPEQLWIPKESILYIVHLHKD